MTPKQFVGLGVAAVATSVFAIMTYVAARPWTETGLQSHEALLPGLRSVAVRVAAIEIESGKERLRLAQQDGKWLVGSHDGYPADAQAVRKLTVAATEADLVERKTAKKDLLNLLGLADGDGGGTARKIRFLDDKGSNIGEILAGSARAEVPGTSGGGTYVRRPGQDQAWLANRPLDGGTSLRHWVKTKLIDVSTKSIESVNIDVPGESPLVIKRDDDKNSHTLSDIPEGKKLKLVNSIDDIVEAVSLIEFKNVRKAGVGTLPQKAGRATFKTEQGLSAVVEFFSDSKEAWATITPSGEGASKADADELALRAKGWEFEVPVTEVTATLKKRAELLEDSPS